MFVLEPFLEDAVVTLTVPFALVVGVMAACVDGWSTLVSDSDVPTCFWNKTKENDIYPYHSCQHPPYGYDGAWENRSLKLCAD